MYLGGGWQSPSRTALTSDVECGLRNKGIMIVLLPSHIVSSPGASILSLTLYLSSAWVSLHDATNNQMGRLSYDMAKGIVHRDCECGIGDWKPE